jgi:hypothetical protein
MHPLLADPWIAEQIDRAVAPYVGKLSADEIGWMREQLADELASNDQASAVLRRAQPRVVDQSGEVARDPEVAAIEPQPARKAR